MFRVAVGERGFFLIFEPNWGGLGGDEDRGRGLGHWVVIEGNEKCGIAWATARP